MNFFTSSKPTINYTSDDIENIVTKSLSDLKLKINDEVYLTSSRTGVVTRSQAKIDIENKLNGHGRSSIRLLSADPEIDLSNEITEEIVLEILKNGQCQWYFKPGDNIIFTSGEVKKLEELLVKTIKSDNFVELGEFCSSNRVDVMFIKWLLENLNSGDNRFIIENDIIVDQTFYNKLVGELIEKLNKLDQITKLDEVDIRNKDELSPTIQSAVQNSIVRLSRDPTSSSSIKGTFDHQGSVFTPDVYRLSLQNNCLSKLESDGFISQDSIKSAGIKDISKISNLAIHSLVVFIITEKFLDNIKTSIQLKLDSQNGWMDLSDIKYPDDFDNKKDQTTVLENHLLSSFTSTSKSYRLYNNRYLISNGLEKEVKKSLTSYYENSAVNDSETISTIPEVQQSVDNSYEIKQSVLKHAKLPSLNDITSVLSNLLLPTPLPIPLSSSLLSTGFDKDVRTTYQTTLIEKVTEILNQLKSEAIIKLTVYLNGIKTTCSDSKLQAKLVTELLDYSINNLTILNIDPTTITTLNDIDKYLTSSVTPTPETLLPVKQKLITTLESQLKKATDAALILHLAVVIYHGRTLSLDPPGLLRTSGKNVPRILNLLQNLEPNPPSPPSILSHFNTLKTAIVTKQPKTEIKQLADQVRTLLL